MSNPLISKFLFEPALVVTGSEEVFKANLTHAFAAMGDIDAALAAAKTSDAMQDAFWPEADSYLAQFRPYSVSDGVLSIPVKGTLVNDFPYAFGSYATGYEYIRKAVDRGLADPDVKGIAFVINSGGGAVAGNFDLVDHIYAARGTKPMRAFAAEHAYSAAYSLASATDSITVARTGGVGSIGVVTTHVNMAKALEQAGYELTFITYGKHKADGNPYEGLSPDVLKKMQARINELGEVFVSTVARNRGLDAAVVRDTEAATFSAKEAVNIGLADNIGALDAAIVAFATDLNNEKDHVMFSQAELDAAVAEAAASAQPEIAEAARAEERARISAIVNSDAGKARPKAALKLAMNDKFAAVDAEAIVDMLADLPEEKSEVAPDAPKGATGAALDFQAAMDAAQHPQAGQSVTADPKSARRNRIKAAAASAGVIR